MVPLGDQVALATLDDEATAARFAAGVRRLNPSWLTDVVQAYHTVAVFFDLRHTTFADVADQLGEPLAATTLADLLPARLHVIPCCYELAPDLERVARHCGLGAAEVVRLHSDAIYTVYAIGFCPGFPYLGYLPSKLSGMPRLATPRVRVEVGSVGMTGRQTGIYTEPRPGGWNLIGRTPLQLVDVADGYFPLRTGDRVRFEPISAAAFDRLRGQRLE